MLYDILAAIFFPSRQAPSPTSTVRLASDAQQPDSRATEVDLTSDSRSDVIPGVWDIPIENFVSSRQAPRSTSTIELSSDTHLPESHSTDDYPISDNHRDIVPGIWDVPVDNFVSSQQAPHSTSTIELSSDTHLPESHNTDDDPISDNHRDIVPGIWDVPVDNFVSSQQAPHSTSTIELNSDTHLPESHNTDDDPTSDSDRDIVPGIWDVPVDSFVSSRQPASSLATSQSGAQSHASDFHTVQIGSPSDALSYAIPKPVDRPKGMRWLSKDESINVAGLTIPGGMLYFSEHATQFGLSEPSLINATLRISPSVTSLTERLMPHWPCYRNITAEARRAYLQWLAGGRRELADISYVFLFFYGLERRALIDALSNPQASAEIFVIRAEVERLLSIYGDDNSFHGYAKRFLAYIDAGSVLPRSYLNEPAFSAPDEYELPLLQRVALGQMAVDKYPLNPSWALAWVLAEPSISRRTPVTRCPEQFAKLFKSEFAKRYPHGIALPQPETRLMVTYRPASPQLHIPAMAVGVLPDIAATSETRNELQVIVEECATVLDAYSRYLGRNPDAGESLEAILQLPIELWPYEARAELEQLEQRVGGESVCMSIGELAGRFKSAGPLSRDKVVGLARALESKRIGLEPDVLTGSSSPKAEDTIALFAAGANEGTLRTTDAYSAAAVTLDLASAVAAADGATSFEEVRLLSSHIDSWDHLCIAHRKRLKAHLQIQRKQPPTLANLKKRLEPLTIEAKRKIARFLAHLAQADGEVTAQEVRLLEQIYKSLALDPRLVYSDLHGASVRSPHYPVVTSPKTVETTVAGDAGPGFVLDMEKIAHLQKETAEVSALLASVFNEESPADCFSTSSIEAPVEEKRSTAERPVTLYGLDVEHSAFLRVLVSKSEWSRAELEAVAGEMQLMLDGALERINDMSFELFDMAMTEGDGPIEINPDILDELAL